MLDVGLGHGRTANGAWNCAATLAIEQVGERWTPAAEEALLSRAFELDARAIT